MSAVEWFGLIICLAGYACWLGSGVWIVVLAFKKSTGWGIAALVIPFAALVFTLRNLDRTKVPLIVNLIGIAFLTISAVLYRQFPSTGHNISSVKYLITIS